MVGGVGTIMAVLGGLIALLNAMNSDRLDKWFAIGAVLLFAGLLMRIEQAVRDKAKPGPRDVAEPGPQG